MQWIMGIDIGVKNLGYCLFNGADLKFGIFNSEEYLTNKIVKECGGVVFGRSKIFADFLGKVFEKYNVVLVVIEKQVQKNTVAKSIESCLGTISIVHGIKVLIYDPKKKFRYLCPKFDSKKKEHKKIVQGYARSILKTFGYTTDYFEEFKKKDDISDAMCMAVFTWFEKHKIDSWIPDLLTDKFLISIV